MTTPKISVIVPVYNTERWLRRCIDSILAQTFTDFELLLIDDGSTDDSGAICDKYAEADPRVRVFHKSNSGVSSARNLGLDNAKGEWIAYIDGDDYVSYDYLNELLVKANQDASDIVFCDFFFSFTDKNVLHRIYSWEKQDYNGLSKFISTSWTVVWGNIHRRNLYVTENLHFPESICYCEDFHLIIRLIINAGHIAKINKALYYYRQQENSIMHNLSNKLMHDEIWAYTDTIKYFKQKKIYEQLKGPMAWRTIKALQDLALNPNTIDELLLINPDKSNYIWNCPFINRKLKLIIWLLTHHLKPIALGIINARNFFVNERSKHISLSPRL